MFPSQILDVQRSVGRWSGARCTRAAFGAWRTTGLRSINTEWTETRGHGECFLRLACALFHPRGVHLGGGFFYHGTHRNALRATQKRPGKDVLRTIRPLLFHLDAYWGGVASGRLTRSRRRHGGTESGFEVGLRAASSTFCLPRGTWGPIRTERSLAGSFKRAVQIRHEVIEMCVSQL